MTILIWYRSYIIKSRRTWRGFSLIHILYETERLIQSYQLSEVSFYSCQSTLSHVIFKKRLLIILVLINSVKVQPSKFKVSICHNISKYPKSTAKLIPLLLQCPHSLWNVSSILRRIIVYSDIHFFVCVFVCLFLRV